MNNKNRHKLIQLLYFSLLTTLSALATANDYELETVVKGISVPWGMAWLPNGDMLVTDRKGDLYRVAKGSDKPLKIDGLPPIDANGQGGLMDLELHPQYGTDPNQGWVYLSLASEDGEGKGSNTAIIRGRLDDDRLIDIETLYKATPNTNSSRHYGSRIEFDNNGYLFFSVGERGERDDNPQDLTRDGGKIYRLHDDGRIPDDNPFVDTANAKKAIYSYGHRNPQGMAKHPTSGKIWAHEHGPRGGDEVNIVKPGANYGWPILSYGINYSGTKFAEGTEREGFESPIWYWDPSIAPSGMTFVTSDKYPEFKGHLLVGSLKFRYLVLAKLDGDTVTDAEVIFEGIGRVRNVKQGPDGFLYVATDGDGIKRIIPKE